MKRCAALVLILLAGTAARAEDESASASSGEIVVTGAGLARPPGDAAYDSIVIDRDQLKQDASGRLEDILRDAAGFEQFRRSDSRSAQPTSQGATLRGLGGNASSRALVLLDGVPQTDPFGGWISWAALAPTRLGMVRVTRGGGSGVYGPGALAGTIELESAGPTDLAPLWASLDYGSRNSVDAQAGVSGTLGGGFGFLAGSYARGDGFIPITRGTRGPIDGRAPYRQGSVAARAAFPVAPDVELQANGLAFYDHRTRGIPYEPNATTGADASLRLIGRGRWGFEALAYTQLRKFTSGFASVNAARTTATATLDQYDVPGTGVGGHLEVRPPLGDAIQLRLGSDARQTQGSTREYYMFSAGVPSNRRIAGGRTLTAGGFAELSAEPASGLTLTAGGRIDRWWIDDGSLRTSVIASRAPIATTHYPNRAGWKPTGRAGIAWKPASAITLRGAGYLGWRLPTLNELYRPFRLGNDSTVANAALKPETVKGVDGGVDWDPLPALHLGATVFWNRLDDAISNVTVFDATRDALCPGLVATGDCIQRRNVRAVEAKGVELGGRLSFGDWRLAAAYSFADPHVRAPGTSLDGLRPAQTPRHQASATLGWQPPQRLSAALTLRYVGPQYEDDQNSEVLKRALTLDASARLPLGHGFAVTARAENLANALVETAITGPVIERATPRTLWIGLHYN